MFQLIFYSAILYVIFFFLASGHGFWFNPKTNYREWYKLNWFGVWFFTILYWIVFLPFTILVAIGWLFTVGRGEN